MVRAWYLLVSDGMYAVCVVLHFLAANTQFIKKVNLRWSDEHNVFMTEELSEPLHFF